MPAASSGELLWAYNGRPRERVSVSLPKPLLDSLAKLAADVGEQGRRTSLNHLLLAVLHFRLPADAAEASELVRSWRLLRAGADGPDPYDGDPTKETAIRIYPVTRARLDVLARHLREEEGLSGARSLVLSAICHFRHPKTPAEAEDLLRQFDLALLGAAERDNEVVGDT
jgi:hypothetical protein